MKSYIVYGNVMKKQVFESGKEAVFFELQFPQDWKFLEQKLKTASFGYAELKFAILGVSELDVLDEPLGDSQDATEPFEIRIEHT